MADPAPREPQSSAVAHETLLALRNALVLTGSLAATLTVAIAVRFWMPRFLGPDAFGRVHFAEAFTAASFVFLHLGVDTYINREIATRPEHASDFFGGIVLVRLAVTLFIAGVIATVLSLMGKGALEWQLVYVFGGGQLLFTFNATMAALLNARGTVRELALVNVSGKLLWGGSVVGGLMLGGGLVWVATSFLITEGLKLPALLWAARRHLALSMRWDVKAGFAVIAASLPYYLNYLAHDIYARIDVSMLSWLINDAEVGWYGVAVNINLLVLLLLPILNAVVLPMGARIARQSTEALNEMMRGAVRLVLIVAIPLAMVLVLNAHTIVPLLYTSEFAPAARALQLLAPMIPLSYVCVLSSMHLVQLGRIWAATRVSLIGLLVHPLINLFVLEWAHRRLGDGGAGLAAAAASLASEALVTALLFRALGRAAAADRKLAVLLAKLTLIVAVVIGVHVRLPGLGIWRVPIELLLYLSLGTLLGAIPLREILERLRAALLSRSRRGA